VLKTAARVRLNLAKDIPIKHNRSTIVHCVRLEFWFAAILSHTYNERDIQRKLRWFPKNGLTHKTLIHDICNVYNLIGIRPIVGSITDFCDKKTCGLV
jgi:hypothetical protein